MTMNTTQVSSQTVFGAPEPRLETQKPLLPFLSDAYLLLLLPTVAYWAYGFLFHWIEQRGYLAQYKLHTPTEILKRNKVPMSKVIGSIIFYQIVTTLLGFWLLRGSEPDLRVDADHEIARWALWLSRTHGNFGRHDFSPDSISRLDWVFGTIMVHLGVPLAQFSFSIAVADTWQYFEHRVVHMNQYLYSECQPSMSYACDWDC